MCIRDRNNPTNPQNSVTGNNGTNYGATAQAGKIGGASFFSGAAGTFISTDYVPSFTSSATISVWVKPGSSQSEYADILGNHANDGGYKTGMVMQQDGTNLNKFGWGYGNGSSWPPGTPVVQFATNSWQYAVAVKTGTRNYMYLNSVSQGYNNDSSSTVSYTHLTLPTILRV